MTLVVKDGQILAQTWDIAMSHRAFVERTLGGLPEGAWVGTVGKFKGEIFALNSRTFFDNQLVAPESILDMLRTTFR